MGDLIDRDALGVGPANPNVFKRSAYADGWNALLRIINQAPVVDAVPVVRCKHCVYGEPCKWPVESDRYYCTHPQSAFYYRGKTQCTFVLSHEKNHYCDFGKQRENAE